MKKATLLVGGTASSKSYLGLLTGLLIGGIQHYMMMRALWGTFTLTSRGSAEPERSTNSKKKPIAQTIDRRLNHR